MLANNFIELFFEIASQKEQEIAAYFKNNEEEAHFSQITWKEKAEKVKNLAVNLKNLGLNQGEHIGILSNTRLEWTISDLGIMANGSVVATFYHTCTPEELIYLIKDSGIKFLFIEDKKQFKKIMQITDQINLKGLCLIEKFDHENIENIPVYYFSDLIQNSSNLEFEPAKIQSQDMATIVYTSGTSGQLKGVVLTHKNILLQLNAIAERVPIKDQHSLLAFLTSAHIFQRIAGELYFISQGQPIYYCKRIERIGQYLKESKATIVLAVPLLMQKIKDKTLAGIENLPDSQKNAVQTALKAAIELKKIELGAKSFTLRFAAKMAHKALYKSVLYKIKEKISPNLIAVISGGAPISPETVLFFHAIGIYLVEGYGLTETTGIMSANSEKFLQPESVGKPLKNLQVKIAEDDEILVKGEVIFEKYWQKPEATIEAFTEDNWFKTGDLGRLDKENFLYIIGRKKDLIVNAGGKKISPVLIEESLKVCPYIDQVAIFGDKQKWLIALITLHTSIVLKQILGEAGESKIDDWPKIAESDEVKKLIGSELEKLCSHLAEHEKIRKFKILVEPFSQAKDELTHTMKLKRRIIEKNYAQEINKLYEI